MDKKSPDVRYICRISGWGFKHLAVRGWFRHADSTLKSWTKDEFQSPRGEGVVQTRHTICHLISLLLSFNHLAVRGWFRLYTIVTSWSGRASFNHLAVRGWFRLQTHEPAWLCGKPGFGFLKNIYYVSFYHSYKYSLAHLSRNVNRFPAKKAAWLSPPPARNGRSVIRIGIDDRGSDSSSSADDGSKYTCTHENHLLNVESEKNHQKMPQRSGESSRRGLGFMILLMVSPPFI